MCNYSQSDINSATIYNQNKRHKINIVSVVYSEELPFLRNQARSLAIYFKEEDVKSICIIINDKDEDKCLEHVQAMLPLYGLLRDRVQIFRPSDFMARKDGMCKVPLAALKCAFVTNPYLSPIRRNKGWKGNSGWMMQQAFKLSISRIVSDDYILILDCKNFFVSHVTSLDFISSSGRPKSRLTTPSPAQKNWIENSFDIFGISLPDSENCSAPSTTPFCVETSLLRDCLNEVENRIGPIECYFGYRPLWAKRGRKASEFMLIFAYVNFRFQNWMNIFEPGLVPAASINRKMDDRAVECMIDLVENGNRKVFSVHRARLQSLKPMHVHRIKKILVDHNLKVSDLFF